MTVEFPALGHSYMTAFLQELHCLKPLYNALMTFLNRYEDILWGVDGIPKPIRVEEALDDSPKLQHHTFRHNWEHLDINHESAKDHENSILSKMDFPVPLKLCQHRVQTLKTESKFAIGNNFQFHKKMFYIQN